MEDLAGLVLQQMRLTDGTGQFCLVFSKQASFFGGYHTKDSPPVMLVTAARIKGNAVYELSFIAEGAEDQAERRAAGRAAIWQHAVYDDISLAASFVFGFMCREKEHEHNRYLKTCTAHTATYLLSNG